MSDFKHALTLWNEGGFIPLFTNFISWINEANIEINTLSQRLTNTTLLFQKFVKLHKKQLNQIKNKDKTNNDLKFENDALKKENEWLRAQLMDLSSTISTSHQQMKSLENKENMKTTKFLKELEKMESDTNNAETDDDDDFHKVGNVTIFQTLSPENNNINENEFELISRPKTKKMRLSNSCRTRRRSRSRPRPNINANKNKTNQYHGSKKKVHFRVRIQIQTDHGKITQDKLRINQKRKKKRFHCLDHEVIDKQNKINQPRI